MKMSKELEEMEKNSPCYCGEITYESKDGNVHSDFHCGCGEEEDGEVTERYRKYLHDSLDEWLNKSKGTGAFWVGDASYFHSWERPW